MRGDNRGGRGWRVSIVLMLILALSVFTVWMAVAPAGANEEPSVTRVLPDYVEPSEMFVVTLNQSGFKMDIGIVWEVLPEGFGYVNGSYTGGVPDRVTYDPITRTLEVSFAMETSITYSVNASSYDQPAEFSGTWKAIDSEGNETNGTVGGDTEVVVEGAPPAPVISSYTHPDEDVWYCNRNPIFTWTTPPDASGIACYSYTIDNSPTTTPDTTCDTPGNSKSYTNLDYGIWYFHVRAKDNDGYWGPADHYRVKIENCDVKDGCYAYGTGCEDRNYYCSGGSCEYAYSNRHTDGWADTGEKKWIDDPGNECKEEEQQKQEYRDYSCSAGSCVYTVTDTRWVDTGNTRNKPDGTDCGTDYWADTGEKKWVNDPGNECKEKEQKEQEYRDYSCTAGSCVYSVTNTRWIDTGDTRNKPEGTDCGSDYYDVFVFYCKEDEVWKHRQFHDFYCEGGSCADHTSWVDDQMVENCNNNDGWMDSGDKRWIDDPGNECKEKEQKEQEYRDYSCSAGSCVYTVTDTRWVDTGNTRNKQEGTDCGTDYWVDTGEKKWVDDQENECKEKEQKEQEYRDYSCTAGSCVYTVTDTRWVDTGNTRNKQDGTDCGTDGWVDTGEKKWVNDSGNECKEKEQKEQEYRDYSCTAGSCVYTVTDTQWIDTGNTRNKPEGTDCGSDHYDDWVTYCGGGVVWKHRQFHDFYCEGGSCADHTSWVDDQMVENCNNNDGWMDSGDKRWIDDPGNECKEKEQKEQEYHDYSCSAGSCVYTVANTRWVDTGNERERIIEIDVRPDGCRMNISEEKQFSAIATLTAGGTEDVTPNASWSSSNTSVLEHLDGGNFKAKSKGIVEVIANYCNKSGRTIVKVNISAGFDTGASVNPYPSISGTHNGTIKPNATIEVSTLYTYPCPGTGGHTEYARIWNDNTGLNVTATWEGYAGDWHNISFNLPFTLIANETYNYTLRTGSYPQIHHNMTLTVPNGEIACTKFTGANGRVYYDRIPAFRLFLA